MWLEYAGNVVEHMQMHACWLLWQEMFQKAHHVGQSESRHGYQHCPRLSVCAASVVNLLNGFTPWVSSNKSTKTEKPKFCPCRSSEIWLFTLPFALAQVEKLNRYLVPTRGAENTGDIQAFGGVLVSNDIDRLKRVAVLKHEERTSNGTKGEISLDVRWRTCENISSKLTCRLIALSYFIPHLTPNVILKKGGASKKSGTNQWG